MYINMLLSVQAGSVLDIAWARDVTMQWPLLLCRYQAASIDLQ